MRARGSSPTPKRSSLDPAEWCAENLQVIPEQGMGSLCSLIYNPIQTDLNVAFDDMIEREGRAQIIVLKARRHGVSTWFQSRIFERITRHSNIRALVLAHEDDASSELFDISRLFLDNCASAPLRLNDSSTRIRYASPHWSSLRVQTAFRHKGSGSTIHMLHVSELAKWKDPLTTMLSLRQAGRLADVVIESTANGQYGQGRYFYEQWVMAEQGKSGYLPKFYAWFDNPLYTIDENSATYERWISEPMSDYEEDLIETYNLLLGQIAWRRATMANECGGDPDSFSQEYPASPSEAFVRVEGQRVFLPMSDVRRNEMRAEKFNQEFPPEVGRLDWIVEPKLDAHQICTNKEELAVEFVPDGGGGLTVWQRPEETAELRRYIGASDIAKGVEGGDSNSSAILDRGRRLVVAQWHTLCDASLYGDFLARLALWYDAEMAVELDGVGTDAIRRMLNLIGGKYVWANHKLQEGVIVEETDFGKWGWKAMNRHTAVTGLSLAQSVCLPCWEALLPFSMEQVPSPCLLALPLLFICCSDGLAQ